MATGYRELVGNRNFTLIWLGQATSRFGDTFYDLALIWLALQISHQNYWSAGLVIFTECAPYLLFGVLGGVASDRWDRRWLMIVCDILRGLVTLILPLLALLGLLALWHLAVVAFVSTTLRIFFHPSLQASVPQVVDDQQVVAANGMLYASYKAATVLGPVTAGFLFARLPASALFVLDSITFFVSALLLGFIRLPRVSSDERRAKPSIWHDLSDAVLALRSVPIVLWSILLTALSILVIAGIIRLGLPAFTTQALHGGPEVYGLLMSGMGLGTVIGALLLGRLHNTQHSALLFVGWIAYGLFLGLIGASAWLPLALLFATLTGGAAAIIDVMTISGIQLKIPQQQMGKVLSFYATLANLGESASVLVIGAVLGFFAVVPVLIASGVIASIIGVIGLLLILRTTVRRNPRPQHVESPELVEQHVV
jgi:MFS transporter, DHA3 family, macrolide efflux protein